LIKKLPKEELHNHLDGASGRKRSWSSPGIRGFPSRRDAAELADWFHRGSDRKSLALYLEASELPSP
jgi:hypothetical protein